MQRAFIFDLAFCIFFVVKVFYIRNIQTWHFIHRDVFQYFKKVCKRFILRIAWTNPSTILFIYIISLVQTQTSCGWYRSVTSDHRHEPNPDFSMNNTMSPAILWTVKALRANSDQLIICSYKRLLSSRSISISVVMKTRYPNSSSPGWTVFLGLPY